MRYFAILPVAWLVGITTYATTLFALFGETISAGDLQAAAILIFVAIAVLFPCLYYPTIRVVYSYLGGWRPLIMYPLALMPLAVFPTVLIIAIMGGRPGSIMSPEAFLLLLSFGMIGATIGAAAAAWR